MRSICRSIWCAAAALAASGGVAQGADSPLLVSVEVAPGVDVGPAEVRRTIATELGTPVVGTREPSADDAADVLLVTVEPKEVRMSLRAGATPVSRTIAAPPDRPGRLRSIGWLAGNLVRDQVGPLVASGAAPPSPMPSIAEARPPTEPPPVPAAAVPSDSAAPAAVVASRPSPREDALPYARWAVTAGGGPTLNVSHYSDATSDGETDITRGTAYQIEVQYQPTPDGLLYGAALQVGPEVPTTHYFGGAAFAGWGWRRGKWFVEANLGLGVEALQGRMRRVTVTNSSQMLGTVEETTVSFEPMAALYGRAAAVGGVRVARTFDLVAQLGAHLSSTGQRGYFLNSTFGVRMRLP